MSQLYICNKANKYRVCKDVYCLHSKPFIKWKGMMQFTECVIDGVTGKTVKIKDVKYKQASLPSSEQRQRASKQNRAGK